MNKLLAISAAYASLAIGAIPVLAEVDLKTHELCIEAKDYAGCVRAMKGDTSSSTSRVITSQGADVAEGNQCTAGYAYIGGGNCQSVSCNYPATDLGHDQLIAGKIDRDGNDVWGCKYNWIYGAGELRLTGAVTRTSNNPDCPEGEPELGFNNTCQTAIKGWLSPKADAERAKKEGPKCNFKLQKYGCSFDKYLEANLGMKKWSELNPDMAAKERIKLQSID